MRKLFTAISGISGENISFVRDGGDNLRFQKERKRLQGNTALTTERPFLPFTAKGTTEELWDGGLKI